MQNNVFFYFSDKPGKQVAWVLASLVLKQTFPAIKKANGEPTKDTQVKLQIFSDLLFCIVCLQR